MNYGYIKFHRQILDWEWYSDINVCRLFTHLLLKANFENKRWRGIIVKRGQYVTSRDKLSDETGLSVQQARTALDKLKSTGEITIQTTNSFTIVTICNYSHFQGDVDSEQPTDNQQITNEQPTDNQQITNEQPQLKKDNKDKNIKKDKNENYLNAQFEEFWELYGYKIDKKKARLAYDKAIKKNSHDAIIDGVKKYQAHIQETGKQAFVKHPTTFLNSESFNNEYPNGANYDTSTSKNQQSRASQYSDALAKAYQNAVQGE